MAFDCMLKDRAQKSLALKLSISLGWFPQLEVAIIPEASISKNKYMLTDIDVLAMNPPILKGLRRVAFDCKSSTKESAIGRAFWLYGVMKKSGAAHGFVILNNRVHINHDHRISAYELNIALLHENEMENLAQSIGGTTRVTDVLMADMETWEYFFSIKQKFPMCNPYFEFALTKFWSISGVGERCRKTVGSLRRIRSELDPKKPEHLAVFGDAVSLFLLSLAEMANVLFLVLIRPSSREEFSNELLALLYGGYENLEAAQKIRYLTASNQNNNDAISIFPAIEQFEELMREALVAPREVFTAALIAREEAFRALMQENKTDYQISLAGRDRYSTKYLMLASEYLCLASRIPSEFGRHFSDRALKLAGEAVQGS